MTKTAKTIAAFTMAALVTGGSLVAQSAKKADAKIHSTYGTHGFIKAIIGQVTKTNKSSFSVIDVDGNELELTTVPFTSILFEPEMKEGTLADITVDSWVIVTTFKTDTEKTVASTVCVKPAPKKAEANPENPDFIDAK